MKFMTIKKKIHFVIITLREIEIQIEFHLITRLITKIVRMSSIWFAHYVIFVLQEFYT